jgi:hypothetical protein
MKRARIMNLADPPDEVGAQIVNAGIMAGVSFFTALAGITASGLMKDPATGILAAVLSAGLSFFTSLAIQRGLMKATG